MWKSPEPRYDVACAISQGGREYQEDAIVTDFPAGADTGIAVLADGMGGHAAGDIASKIVVTEVFSDLKFNTENFDVAEGQIPELLRGAATRANESIRDYVRENPKTRGMGSTVVAMVFVQNRMYHISIGDSPLYRFRNGTITQLNEDHSLASQIDFMVQSGMLTEEQAKDHPDRNCLTSVILGDKIARTDCPAAPIELVVGDVIVVSSDGLQYLEDADIQRVVKRYRRKKSAEIAEHLLEALYKLDDPDQDNISFAVIKLNHNKPVARKIKPRQEDYIAPTTASTTRVAEQPLIADDETVKVEEEPKMKASG